MEILAWVPVVSGHHSIELISPDSLQGFRLTKALGSQGCKASCFKMRVSAGENVCVCAAGQSPCRHESQHVEKDSIFWVHQQQHREILVIALYPSQLSQEQMKSPEVRQSGTTVWGAAH